MLNCLFIQIHHEAGDPSESASIECVFEAHCDAASTKLEATLKADATTEAAAVNDVGNEQLLSLSSIINSTEEDEMKNVN